MKNTYIVVDHFNGKIDDITFEMLGKAKEMGQATAIIIGNSGLANQLGKADKVITAGGDDLANFNPQAALGIISKIVKDGNPDQVMIGYTSAGVDLASGLSVTTGRPLIAYASKISGDGVTSQLYGGKVSVDSNLPDHCILSIVPGSFPAEAGKGEGSPSIETADVSSAGLAIKFKKMIEPEGGDVDITIQDVLVSVGRGIKDEESIEIAVELANKLGGTVSCSRPIVDNKWLAKTRQVGKSGLKVKPKLYLALGISGAPEHIEGMKDAELIIAVNTDPGAPIFEYAHYGTTCDLFDLIPALNERL